MATAKKALFLDLDGTIITHTFMDEKPQPIFKELPEFLERLHKEGTKLFIVTSRSEKIRSRLKQAGINPKLFTDIVMAKEIAQEEVVKYYEGNLEKLRGIRVSLKEEFILKAIAIEKLMEKHGLDKRNVLFVGDTPKADAAAARLVGIPHGNVMDKYSELRLEEQHFVKGRYTEPTKRNLGPTKRSAKRQWNKGKAVKRFLRH